MAKPKNPRKRKMPKPRIPVPPPGQPHKTKKDYHRKKKHKEDLITDVLNVDTMPFKEVARPQNPGTKEVNNQIPLILQVLSSLNKQFDNKQYAQYVPDNPGTPEHKVPTIDDYTCMFCSSALLKCSCTLKADLI